MQCSLILTDDEKCGQHNGQLKRLCYLKEACWPCLQLLILLFYVTEAISLPGYAFNADFEDSWHEIKKSHCFWENNKFKPTAGQITSSAASRLCTWPITERYLPTTLYFQIKTNIGYYAADQTMWPSNAVPEFMWPYKLRSSAGHGCVIWMFCTRELK